MAFWAVNLGLVGFVVGLILQEAVIKRLFSPVMGVGILVVMAVYALRLQQPALATPRAAPGRG